MQNRVHSKTRVSNIESLLSISSYLILLSTGDSISIQYIICLKTSLSFLHSSLIPRRNLWLDRKHKKELLDTCIILSWPTSYLISTRAYCICYNLCIANIFLLSCNKETRNKRARTSPQASWIIARIRCKVEEIFD
jgi:hypothetical protein